MLLTLGLRLYIQIPVLLLVIPTATATYIYHKEGRVTEHDNGPLERMQTPSKLSHPLSKIAWKQPCLQPHATFNYRANDCIHDDFLLNCDTTLHTAESLISGNRPGNIVNTEKFFPAKFISQVKAHCAWAGPDKSRIKLLRSYDAHRVLLKRERQLLIHMNNLKEAWWICFNEIRWTES